eukprot:755601-Pyramimonas_sp.AAC.1
MSVYKKRFDVMRSLHLAELSEKGTYVRVVHKRKARVPPERTAGKRAKVVVRKGNTRKGKPRPAARRKERRRK